MAENEPKQFLLGRGERLAENISYRGKPSNIKYPYSKVEAKERLGKILKEQLVPIRKLPDEYCPLGLVVSEFTLHPSFISRSNFPLNMMNVFGFRLLGSKPTQIKPERGKGSGFDEGAATTTLFMAGTKPSFEALANDIEHGDSEWDADHDLQKIEQIGYFSAEHKIHGEVSTKRQLLELVLHFDSYIDGAWEDDFYSLAEQLEIALDLGNEYQTRGLLFVPAMASRASINKLANFTFVRAVRPMPKLRIIDRPNILRSKPAHGIELPTQPAIDANCKMAIFDGGLLADHPFSNWVDYIEPPANADIGDPLDHFLEHGTAVTSGALFGSVSPGVQSRPFAAIDHYRVLGKKSDDKLYSTMLYVDEILSQSSYDLVNFSIGPYEVAGDDTVTAWTAMLDDHFGTEDTLATIAVGNDGDQIWPASRIQVPSDCVNALAVGSADSADGSWKRATYSSIGPGRHPGYVKPDLVQFGGSSGELFNFILTKNNLAEGMGTSYASPALLRVAAGLRAYFGSDLSSQAIRALLIHTANSKGISREEVGWGLVQNDLDSIVTCGDGVVRVVYQGKLEPSKVLRAAIPLPDDPIKGMITIKATFCYSCLTDPNSPGEYTRSGLDVTFRPKKSKYKTNPKYPDSSAFFKRHEKSNEASLRVDAHKWDTVMHNSRKMRGSGLDSPVFDIHYIAREPGRKTTPPDATKIAYALIVTLEAKKVPNLYSLVQTKYKNRLSELRPNVEIPIRV